MKRSLIAASIAALAASTALAQGTGTSQPGDQIIRQEQPAGPGATLNVSPAVVRQIQQALNQKGYQAGNVDGEWSSASQEAMTQFQKAQGLEPTGNINQRSLAALGIDPTGGQQQASGGGQQASEPGQQQASGGGQQQPAQPGQQQASQPQQQDQQQQAMGAGQGQQPAAGSGQMPRVETGDAVLLVSPAVVRMVQENLKQRGYEVGQASGELDDKTREGLRKFQQSEQLEATGQPNPKTLAALDIDVKRVPTDQAGTGASEPARMGAGAGASGSTSGGQIITNEQPAGGAGMGSPSR